MPILVDGNNLMFALRRLGADVGRGGLCQLLGKVLGPREAVEVVFDGAAPVGPLAQQVGHEHVDVSYGQGRSADEVMEERIAASSAPRRLTVVSTDRAIRKAARRRRCRIVESEAFAAMLVAAASAPAPPRPVEPPGKRHGLPAGEADRWMKDLGLADPDPEEAP